jgi:hypothetical protein
MSSTCRTTPASPARSTASATPFAEPRRDRGTVKEPAIQLNVRTDGSPPYGYELGFQPRAQQPAIYFDVTEEYGCPQRPSSVSQAELPLPAHVFLQRPPITLTDTRMYGTWRTSVDCFSVEAPGPRDQCPEDEPPYGSQTTAFTITADLRKLDTTPGGRRSPAPAASSLVTKREAAAVLGVPVRKVYRHLRRSKGYVPYGRGAVAYSDDPRGVTDISRSLELYYRDFRATPWVYTRFKNGRYGGCPRGPRLGDKTCWDRTLRGPRDLTLFARNQTARINVRGVRRKPGEARVAALMRRVLPRLAKN